MDGPSISARKGEVDRLRKLILSRQAAQVNASFSPGHLLFKFIEALAWDSSSCTLLVRVVSAIAS